MQTDISAITDRKASSSNLKKDVSQLKIFVQSYANSQKKDLTMKEVQYCWLGFIKKVPSNRLENLLKLRKNYRVCLASNTNPFIMAFTRSNLFSDDGHGIEYYFDKLYCSYEIGVCKPSEEFFKKVLNAEGVKPEEVIFVDDSKKNIAAAEALGIKGVWVAPDSDWMTPLEDALAK